MRKCKRQLKIMLGQDLRTSVQLDCPVERYGSHYGGWYLFPDLIDSNSVVYSFGVGEDISFDLALIQNLGVEVHAFDPTPRSIEWVKRQNLPDAFVMHPYGIAALDGVVPFYPPENPAHVSHTILDRSSTGGQAIMVPVHRLITIMNMLDHSQVDLLKMDIEGAEYEVVEDIITSRIPIRQILVEFHHRFPGVSITRTKESIKRLNVAGYQIIAISESGEEYSFLKT